MSDLIERMRAKLQHARDHRMVAAPVDLEDLEKLIAQASCSPTSTLWYCPECPAGDPLWAAVQLVVSSEQTAVHCGQCSALLAEFRTAEQQAVAGVTT